VRLAALVLVAACSAGSRPPGLPAAGSRGDDGSGQLARASAQIELGDDSGRRSRAAADEGGLGGSMYGGSTYGDGADSPVGGIGFVPLPARATDYAGVDVATGGIIDGVVRGRTAGPREGALVYLAQIARGRPFAGAAAGRTMPVGGLVEKRGGALWPALQVVAPAPVAVTVSNADPGSIVLVGSGPVGFRAALATGDRRTVPAGAGITRIEDPERRLAPAWIVGLGHPYHALTDAGGRFRLDQVPPGRYQLEVLYPAPAGDLVIVRRPVVVPASGSVRVALDLP
jgi:hypothetical protein